jgi:hypothetical protein
MATLHDLLIETNIPGSTPSSKRSLEIIGLRLNLSHLDLLRGGLGSLFLFYPDPRPLLSPSAFLTQFPIQK